MSRMRRKSRMRELRMEGTHAKRSIFERELC